MTAALRPIPSAGGNRWTAMQGLSELSTDRSHTSVSVPEPPFQAAWMEHVDTPASEQMEMDPVTGSTEQLGDETVASDAHAAGPSGAVSS